jgi:hypothetical protein
MTVQVQEANRSHPRQVGEDLLIGRQKLARAIIGGTMILYFGVLVGFSLAWGLELLELAAGRPAATVALDVP